MKLSHQLLGIHAVDEVCIFIKVSDFAGKVGPGNEALRDERGRRIAEREAGRIDGSLFGQKSDAELLLLCGRRKDLLGAGKIGHPLDLQRLGRFPVLFFKGAHETLEIEALKDLVSLLIVDIAELQRIEIRLHGSLRANCSQLLGENREVVVLLHRGAGLLRGDLGDMLVRVFDAVIF